MNIFLWGLVGGIAAEVLHWYGLRESLHLPDYARSWFYWLITVVMILLGGALARAYSIDNTLLAINVGASAPLIIKALATTVPQPQNKQAPTKFSPMTSVIPFLAGR